MAAPAAIDPNALPLKRYLGYGLGDFAFNFYWLPLQVFLLKYYTDVLGLDSATAGVITLVCLLWDGLVDPYVGLVASRTRSRFGRYRPYLLFGSVPLAASFCLVFLPVDLDGFALIAYALATQLLFRTVYAVVNIPYGAMMASMTRNSMERNWLAGVRMLFAFAGSAVVGYLTPRLVMQLGAEHPQSAHFLSALILSCVATGVLFACFASTREPEPSAAPAPRSVPLREMLGMILHNRPFLQVAGGIALFGFANTVHMASLAYYVQYVLGQNDSVTGSLAGLIPLVQMLAILPWAWLSRRLGKRLAWISGLLLSAVALLALLWIEQPGVSELLLLAALASLGYAAIAVNFWSMVPDTVEYGEWRSCIRAEGFVFGLMTLIQKAALGASSAFVGVYLGWVGYVPNVAQLESTRAGLTYLLSVVPACALLASCVVMWFYRLNAQTHARLVREIEERNRTAQC
jgi:GPH family glycoside/pentoside/hexuronide:cation symporter